MNEARDELVNCTYLRNPAVRLAAIAMFMAAVGCTTSPYERAVREADERAQFEAQQSAVESRDFARLSSDVLVAVRHLISDANESASDLDDQVFLQVAEYGRIVAFVPGTKPGDKLITYDSALAQPLAEDAVTREWSDHFALAQCLRYRYANPSVQEIRKSPGPPYFVAVLSIERTEEHRSAITGEARPIPDAPSGHVAWRPSGRDLRAGGAQEAPMRPDALPSRTSLPGSPTSATSGLDPMARRAVQETLASTPSVSTSTIIVSLDYDHDTARWKLLSTSGGAPTAVSLDWNHGLDESAQGVYVFRPGMHGTASR